MSDRDAQLRELAAQLKALQTRFDELSGTSPSQSAAHLFSGKWVKRWRGEASEGCEHFVVEGEFLQVVATDAGVHCRYNFKLLEESESAIKLRQWHKSGRSCFPLCEIEIRRDGDGFVGSELANGELVEVEYRPCTEEHEAEHLAIIAAAESVHAAKVAGRKEQERAKREAAVTETEGEEAQNLQRAFELARLQSTEKR
jgi:hypothetical protein